MVDEALIRFCQKMADSHGQRVYLYANGGWSFHRNAIPIVEVFAPEDEHIWAKQMMEDKTNEGPCYDSVL